MKQPIPKPSGTNKQKAKIGNAEIQPMPNKPAAGLPDAGSALVSSASRSKKRPHHSESKGSSSPSKRAKASAASEQTSRHMEQRPSNGKRPLDNDTKKMSDRSNPNKRSKRDGCNENANQNMHSKSGHPNHNGQSKNTTEQVVTSTPDSNDSMHATEIQHLIPKYNFLPMSILSSSKLESKITTLLKHINHFDFADANLKPGIAILSAKAGVASKLCSIVEIAKNAIVQEKGTWWQYSKLQGQMTPLKTKPSKRTGGGKTLAEWEQEQAGSDIATQGEGPKTLDDEDVEMNDAFETMKPPNKTTFWPPEQEDEANIKVRDTPVMTIYFARVPVPGLKEIYG